MTILSTQMDEVVAGRQQAKDLLTAYLKLKLATASVFGAVNDIQLLIDSGSFDSIPNELKGELNQWFIVLKSAKTTIEADLGIMELYGGSWQNV